MNKVEIHTNGTRSVTRHATLAMATEYAGTEKAALGYTITRILINGEDF